MRSEARVRRRAPARLPFLVVKEQSGSKGTSELALEPAPQLHLVFPRK